MTAREWTLEVNRKTLRDAKIDRTKRKIVEYSKPFIRVFKMAVKSVFIAFSLSSMAYLVAVAIKS